MSDTPVLASAAVTTSSTLPWKPSDPDEFPRECWSRSTVFLLSSPSHWFRGLVRPGASRDDCLYLLPLPWRLQLQALANRDLTTSV